MRIALIGKSGTGKSEAAKCFASLGQLRVVKTGRICREISKLLFGNEDKSSTQLLDDALTRIDPSIFLRAALRGVDTSTPIVVDALRFRSDLEVARSLGLFTVRIVARPDTRVARLSMRGQVFDASRDGYHRSELELDDAAVDAEIENDGTLDELQRRVEELIRGR